MEALLADRICYNRCSGVRLLTDCRICAIQLTKVANWQKLKGLFWGFLQEVKVKGFFIAGSIVVVTVALAIVLARVFFPLGNNPDAGIISAIYTATFTSMAVEIGVLSLIMHTLLRRR